MVTSESGQGLSPLSAEQLRSISAELTSMLNQIEQQADRMELLAGPTESSDREDVAVALREAERQLHMARRAVQRAQRTVDG